MRNSILDDRRESTAAIPLLFVPEVETGVLPKAHGSALFARGETQTLVVTTLARSEMQLIEGLDARRKTAYAAL